MPSGRQLDRGEQRRGRLHTPTNSFWLNRIEAQLTALRYFTLDGTDHTSHKQQGSMIRRYIIWRNKHAQDERLRKVVARANVA
ncbi:hypothetical protein GCM10023336_01530 [Streptomyces similanensis]|uniref:Transposase n=1 Tax=Streptomyces similanensis TaxID=1274988 RepID=A0ABP9JSN3_9ACTN